MVSYGAIRHDWTKEEVLQLFDLPFPDLMYHAQTIHRQHFSSATVQTCKLLSIKTGACPEDCAYCPQSAHYKTNVTAEKLMDVDEIVKVAKDAKSKGVTRFCMATAWRDVKEKHMNILSEIIKSIRALGLETCMTLGMVDLEKAKRLKEAGLDYYNHNLDTSPEFYPKIISTRTYQDRLNTLENVRQAGMHVCSGGILGMGEQREDRAELLRQLANLSQHPESVTINKLLRIKGTPLADMPPIDSFEFIRTVAAARIMMPKAFVRVCAGRAEMSDEMQALCLLAGGNSIFIEELLLTQKKNPALAKDEKLLQQLGMEVMTAEQLAETHA